jgi:hypothetical protein
MLALVATVGLGCSDSTNISAAQKATELLQQQANAPQAAPKEKAPRARAGKEGHEDRKVEREAEKERKLAEKASGNQTLSRHEQNKLEEAQGEGDGKAGSPSGGRSRHEEKQLEEQFQKQASQAAKGSRTSRQDEKRAEQAEEKAQRGEDELSSPRSGSRSRREEKLAEEQGEIASNSGRGSLRGDINNAKKTVDLASEDAKKDAEQVVRDFLTALAAGNTEKMASLITRRAQGNLARLRNGELGESALAQVQETYAGGSVNGSFYTTKNSQRSVVVEFASGQKSPRKVTVIFEKDTWLISEVSGV